MLFKFCLGVVLIVAGILVLFTGAIPLTIILILIGGFLVLYSFGELLASGARANKGDKPEGDTKKTWIAFGITAVIVVVIVQLLKLAGVN